MTTTTKTTTCNRCGATVTVKNIARHLKSTACTSAAKAEAPAPAPAPAKAKTSAPATARKATAADHAGDAQAAEAAGNWSTAALAWRAAAQAASSRKDAKAYAGKAAAAEVRAKAKLEEERKVAEAGRTHYVGDACQPPHEDPEAPVVAPAPVAPAPAKQPAPAAAPPKAKADKLAARQARAAEQELRAPAVGTVLTKHTRDGRTATCIREEGGYRLDGVLHESISAAALAASKLLGLGAKAQNGYVFWGLKKSTAPRTDRRASGAAAALGACAGEVDALATLARERTLPATLEAATAEDLAWMAGLAARLGKLAKLLTTACRGAASPSAQ